MGNNLDTTFSIVGQSSKCHDCDAGLDWQKIWSVMTTAFWEDADAAAGFQFVKHRIIDLRLINKRSNLERAASRFDVAIGTFAWRTWPT